MANTIVVDNIVAVYNMETTCAIQFRYRTSLGTCYYCLLIGIQ